MNGVAAQRRTPLGFVAVATLLGLAACGEPDAPASAGNDVFRAMIAERASSLDPHAAGIGRIVPDLAFEDLDGRRGRLSDVARAKALAILVRDVGCPVSKKQGPALARLEDEFTERGVAFLYVNMAPHDTAQEMRAEIATYGFDGPYVHDPDAAFGRALRARTTTDTFVLDAARTLVYRGAVDDQYGRGTVPLERAERSFLRDALEATLAGRPVVASATTAPGCLLGLELPDPGGDAAGGEPLTWHRDISRIVQASCQECHRRGGAAPFPLETYAQTVGRKGMVRFVVSELVMPPWFADDEGATFANDRRLTEADRGRILRWIADGCPEGDPRDAPVPREWQEGWQIGTPDVTFQLPRPFELPAEGVVDLQTFYCETVVPEDLWVERMQLLPTNPEVVHHATILFKPPPREASNLTDLLVPWMQERDGWKFLLGYLPGNGPRVYQQGVAGFLPKGSRIRFEMHYTPNGRALADQSTLGIVLADGPPDYVVVTRLIRNRDIFIPAGAKDVAFDIGYSFPHRVVLRALMPHMHLIGHTFHVDLRHVDGTIEPLLRIAEWDPDWQFTYVLEDQPTLPPGSRIQVHATFDNSADNPNNPDPTTDVRDGPQIWDEMLMLAIEWLEPRAAQ